MTCVARAYNTIMLRPDNNKDRELFWKFRCKDIAEMFNYAMASAAVAWTGITLVSVLNPNDLSLKQRYEDNIEVNLTFLTYCIVWFIGRRFKTVLVHLLPFLFAIMEAIAYFRVKSEDSIPVGSAIWIPVTTVAFCTFLSPHIVHTLVYTVIFFALSFDKASKLDLDHE